MKPDLQLREAAHKARRTPDTELQEPQELGQQHYRAQEYQHALRCFTEVRIYGQLLMSFQLTMRNRLSNLVPGLQFPSLTIELQPTSS